MKKFAIITGASRGIGKGIADYFAQKQFDLALIAKNSTGLEETAENIKRTYPTCQITTHAIDLSDPKESYKQIQSIVEQTDRLDVLFNNAGIWIPGSDELSTDDFEQMINVNLIGFFGVAKVGLEKMAQQKFGYLMNLASMAGRRGIPHTAAYAASKYAVVGLSESLHKKYASMGVKITAICPSVVDTDMTKTLEWNNAEKIPVEDIVKTVDYLLSLSPQSLVPISEVHCAAFVAKLGI